MLTKNGPNQGCFTPDVIKWRHIKKNTYLNEAAAGEGDYIQISKFNSTGCIVSKEYNHLSPRPPAPFVLFVNTSFMASLSAVP